MYIAIYLAICLLFKIVIFPYLKIKKNIRFKDDIDQEMLEDMGSLFWPFIPCIPFVQMFFGILRWVDRLAKKLEGHLAQKPEVKEQEVDAAKSTYRHAEYK